jgi:hypothetical protein
VQVYPSGTTTTRYNCPKKQYLTSTPVLAVKMTYAPYTNDTGVTSAIEYY